MLKANLLLAILFIPIAGWCEIGTSDEYKNPGEQKTNSFLTDIKIARFIVNDDAIQKYRCKCYVWSQKGSYRLAHSYRNSEGSTTYFVEDVNNGAVVSTSTRWNRKESFFDMSDVPDLEGTKTCFNPIAVLKVLKQEDGKALTTMTDSEGSNISIWVDQADLTSINPFDKKYQDRAKPAPLKQDSSCFISSAI